MVGTDVLGTVVGGVCTTVLVSGDVLVSTVVLASVATVVVSVVLAGVVLGVDSAAVVVFAAVLLGRLSIADVVVSGASVLPSPWQALRIRVADNSNKSIHKNSIFFIAFLRGVFLIIP